MTILHLKVPSYLLGKSSYLLSMQLPKPLHPWTHCSITVLWRQWPNALFICNLASLPPISAAAQEHSLQAYHQVQHWLGHDLPPTSYGWELTLGQLQSVPTRKPPASDNLMNLISCNCKTGCECNCGCRKAGIPCTLLCGYCCGGGCCNSEKVEPEAESDHGLSGESHSEEPSDGITADV